MGIIRISFLSNTHGRSDFFRFTIRCLVLLLLCLSGLTVNVDAQGLTAKDTANVKFLNARKFYIYPVKKGETLFSISQKFKIPQDEITELNPDLRKNGLKPGSKLWIPAFSWKNKDTGKETAVPEPEKQPKAPSDLNVAVISRMDLGKIYTGDLSEQDTVIEPIERNALSNIEFVEGARMAIDDFHRNHPSFPVHLMIVDSEGDTAQMTKDSWKSGLRKADVWITNETGPTLSCLNRLSMKWDIPLVSCGINTADLLENNESAVAMLPSSLLQCRLMGAFAARHFKDATAIFVKTNNDREKERMMSFKAGWQSEEGGTSCRVADYAKGFSGAVLDSIRGKRHHVVFIPTSNEDMVTGLLEALKEKKNSAEISVVGLRTWFDFQTVDPSLMQSCDVYLSTSAGTINFQDSPELIRLQKNFRETYSSSAKESVCWGYDALLMTAENWRKDGKRFVQKNRKYDGVFTTYEFRAKENSCFENQVIHVWQFKDIVPQRVTQ